MIRAGDDARSILEKFNCWKDPGDNSFGKRKEEEEEVKENGNTNGRNAKVKDLSHRIKKIEDLINDMDKRIKMLKDPSYLLYASIQVEDGDFDDTLKFIEDTKKIQHKIKLQLERELTFVYLCF